MKLEYLNYIPDICTSSKYKRWKLLDAIEEFWNRPEITMKMVWESGDSWISPRSMKNSFVVAVKRSGKPIKVIRERNSNTIYLVKNQDSENDQPSN